MGKHVQLREFLERTFSEAGGRLSFENFMAAALYDPKFGYYTTNISDVGGSRADFSTWATLADLGRPVARWIQEEITCHDWADQRVSLIEIGGGDGSLAHSVLKSLGWRNRRKLDYHIVDISPPLREQQADRLKGRKIHWHESIDSALDQAGGKAILFSNELVDAFPVRWLQWNGTDWFEIFVNYSPETGLKEEFLPCRDNAPTWPSPPPGQRIEVHDSYLRWLDSWLPELQQGSLLTIDYGGISVEEIYGGHCAGTMRGYFRQQRIEKGGIYQRFGTQDLTCDVDFSKLVEHGEAHKIETVRLENQLNFLHRYEASSIPSTEAAERFYVLHQRKR